MKKINLLFVAVLLSVSAFFTSCGSNEEDYIPPTITVVSSTPTDGYVKGKKVTFVLQISSNEDLKTFSVGAGAVNPATGSGVVSTEPANSLTNGTFAKNLTSVKVTYDFVIPDVAVGTSVVVKFTVTDDGGQGTKDATPFVIVSGAGPINSWTAELGATGNAKGSFFASLDGAVYSVATAKTNAAKVDIVYFYSDLQKSTLAAPNDESLLYKTIDDVYGVSSWTTKNGTKFKKVTFTGDFAAITDDAQIVSLVTGADATETRINQLAKDQVIAFVTASGKKGLIKITNITGTTDGSISFSVKVQKTVNPA